MLHLKENSAYGDRLRTKFFFYLGCFLIADYNKQLPTNLDRWRQPGTVEDEEQIWRYLDEALHDAGFTLWRRAFASVFGSPGRTYPLSSGFGYAIPTRTGANEVGSVRMLRQFIFPVCWFYESILSLSDIYMKRMDPHDLCVHEMDWMLSSALLSLEMKGRTI